MKEERQKMSLWLELERVYGRLHAGDDGAEREADLGDAVRAARPLPAAFTAVPEQAVSVASLAGAFDLSAFEADLILLCAGTALEPRFGEVLARLQPQNPAPTFGLAATKFEAPHWSALSPLRPLRYWRLIEMGAGPLYQAPLSIDPRVLQAMLGVRALDERLEYLIRPLADDGERTEQTNLGLAEAAARGFAHWRRGAQGAVLLTGARATERTALFHALRRRAAIEAWSLDAADLPVAADQREQLARAYMREAALWPAALLVHTDRLDDAGALDVWLKRVGAPIAVDVEPGSAAEKLHGLRLSAPSMSSDERKAFWRSRLGPRADKLDGRLDKIVEAFPLDSNEIAQTANALGDEEDTPAPEFEAKAWAYCRAAARHSLEGLATLSASRSGWSDLVLPEGQTAILRQIVIHARHAARVNEAWGFAARHGRGLGLSALFSGASGTGKTMGAGVLAGELERDLYQIDLANLMSKYIGETEKHLRRVFDAAERSGAILLFDEADALFGKRSQVRDSHDRYANLEVSYLLQRMETYRGVAILTTNMQNSLDAAFQRRLRFVAHFPFPDEASRERIWRKVFPAAAPTKDLDYARLAQLNVTGGSISNIAVLAAFLAAEEGEPIAMRHVLAGAQTEYGKLDKPLTPVEIRGWA
jgi:ATPase family associated with various cellular activities (AAA)